MQLCTVHAIIWNRKCFVKYCFNSWNLQCKIENVNSFSFEKKKNPPNVVWKMYMYRYVYLYVNINMHFLCCISISCRFYRLHIPVKNNVFGWWCIMYYTLHLSYLFNSKINKNKTTTHTHVYINIFTVKQSLCITVWWILLISIEQKKE